MTWVSDLTSAKCSWSAWLVCNIDLIKAKQQYISISLENGLKALLIQDSTADKAAAAMDVSFQKVTSITSASLT